MASPAAEAEKLAFTTLPWDGQGRFASPRPYFTRLWQHARRLGIAWPKDFSESLRAALDRALVSAPRCEHAVPPAAPGLLRVQLTKEGDVSVALRAVPAGPGDAWKAISVAAPCFGRHTGAKHGAWSPYAEATAAARSSGAAVALLIHDGLVADGDRCTPMVRLPGSEEVLIPSEARAVHSVTLELLEPRLAPFRVRQADIPLDMLWQAEEVLVVGSGLGVRSLLSLDGRPLGSGRRLASTATRALEDIRRSGWSDVADVVSAAAATAPEQRLWSSPVDDGLLPGLAETLSARGLWGAGSGWAPDQLLLHSGGPVTDVAGTSLLAGPPSLRFLALQPEVCLPSGQIVAEFPVDELEDVNVKSLKQKLQSKCGVPRFRQQLVIGGDILEDDNRLVSPLDDVQHLQLIFVPFINASREQRDELISIMVEDAVTLAQVEEILQRPQDPGLEGSASGPDEPILPVVVAAERGHTDIVRLLAEAAADINKLGYPCDTFQGGTALMWACESGHLDTARALLELGADVDIYQNEERATALIRAAEQAHVDILRLLLEARAQVNQQQQRGRTALVCACFLNNLEAARVLVEAEADLNVQDNVGMTALGWTSGAGHVEVVRLLLQAGAAPALESDVGLTAAVCASAQGHSAIVELLLDAWDASISGPDLITAIAAASIMGRMQTLQLLLEVRGGQDVPDYARCVAVSCTSAKGHVEILRKLLQVGGGTSRQHTDDTLAFLSAVDRGHVASARVLLDNGLPNAAGPAGLQALVSAALRGYDQMVDLLLQSQAGKDLVNAGGSRAIAFICAGSQGHAGLAGWLVQSHRVVRQEMKWCDVEHMRLLHFVVHGRK
ncbi:Ankrd17 [Symbiodinium sp. CCMP2592]|nr:Ankrd17 [Symbiodinium sp. CCMP2592]